MPTEDAGLRVVPGFVGETLDGAAITGTVRLPSVRVRDEFHHTRGMNPCKTTGHWLPSAVIIWREGKITSGLREIGLSNH